MTLKGDDRVTTMFCPKEIFSSRRWYRRPVWNCRRLRRMFFFGWGILLELHFTEWA